MQFTVTVKNADKLINTFRQMADRMDTVATGVIQKHTEELTGFLEDEVKARTPSTSGRLHNSIFGQINVNGTAVEAMVSTPLDYGANVEFGGNRRKDAPDTDGQHMFQRAWDDNTDEIQSRLDNMITDVRDTLLNQF